MHACMNVWTDICTHMCTYTRNYAIFNYLPVFYCMSAEHAFISAHTYTRINKNMFCIQYTSHGNLKVVHCVNFKIHKK